MNSCPSCGDNLAESSTGLGPFLACPRGEGWLLSQDYMDRLVAHPVARELWSKVNRGEGSPSQGCPSCAKPMTAVVLLSLKVPSSLEACLGCRLAWIPAGLMALLPPLSSAEQSPRQAAAKPPRESIVMGRPEMGWQFLPGFLWLPIQYGEDAHRTLPWATFNMVLALFTTGMAAMLLGLREAVETLAFIPEEPLRLLGLTWLTCFFLHGGLFHLLGNIYFLMLFGGKVEQRLGAGRYLLLLLWATLAADLLDFLFMAQGQQPRIGASGGISGLVVYYALEFPNSKLGLWILWIFWIRIPALIFVAVWFLLQVGGMEDMVGGTTDVNHLAHLGGALAGVVLWFMWRSRAPE